MKHLWSIICNKLIVDENTNSATLVEVLEEIRINENVCKDKKFLPIFFDLVSLWLIESDDDYQKENNIIIEFYDSQKNKLDEFKFNFIAPEKRKRVRTSIRFNKFFFKEPGVYVVKVKQNDKKVGEVFVEIIIN